MCTVSDHTVRLWDFDDNFEKPPAIWASEEYGKNQIVDKVFINEGSKEPQYIVVVTGPIFTVFKNRMESLMQANFEETYQARVTSAAFSHNNEILYLGTNIGTLHFIDL